MLAGAPSDPVAPHQTNIAVIGAGGLLGLQLVKHFLDQGRYGVLGVDASDERLAGLSRAGLRFYRADIRHAPEVLEHVVRESVVVVDLVAFANPGMYVSDPLDVFDLHFTPSLAITRLCARHQKRLIMVSSAEAYDPRAEGSAGAEKVGGRSLGAAHDQWSMHAMGRMLLQRLLYAQGAAGKLEFTIVRPFGFTGLHLDALVPAHVAGGPRVLQSFISALLTGRQLRLVDGVHLRRSFIHTEDANSAFQAILDHPEETRSQIYDVANPDNELPVREIAGLLTELYEELTGRCCAESVDVTGKELWGPAAAEPPWVSPDISKLRLLGWSPRHDARSTLRDALAVSLDALRVSTSEPPTQGPGGIHARRRRMEAVSSPHSEVTVETSGRRTAEPQP